MSLIEKRIDGVGSKTWDSEVGDDAESEFVIFLRLLLVFAEHMLVCNVAGQMTSIEYTI